MKSLFLLMLLLAIPFAALSHDCAKKSVPTTGMPRVLRSKAARFEFDPQPSTSPAPDHVAGEAIGFDHPLLQAPGRADEVGCPDPSQPATIIRHDRVVAVADALLTSPAGPPTARTPQVGQLAWRSTQRGAVGAGVPGVLLRKSDQLVRCWDQWAALVEDLQCRAAQQQWEQNRRFRELLTLARRLWPAPTFGSLDVSSPTFGSAGVPASTFGSADVPAGEDDQVLVVPGDWASHPWAGRRDQGSVPDREKDGARPSAGDWQTSQASPLWRRHGQAALQQAANTLDRWAEQMRDWSSRWE